MALPMFEMTFLDVRRLKKFYKKAPRQFSRASANLLDSMAFSNRKESKQIIEDKMTIRNKRFVNASLRVQKTKKNQSINNQESIFGSLQRDRFSGWKEQEFGTQPEQDRIFTVLSRNENWSKPVLPSNRLKPSNVFVTPNDYEGKNKEHRANVMLQILSRKKYKKPFLISGHKKVKKGLYRFVNEKIRRVQSFEKKKKPKRIRWMRIGTIRMGKGNAIRSMWSESIKRIMKF